MEERQTLNSYDPSRLTSYDPNPAQTSSYNPNPAQANSYNPNPAQTSSYNPNPGQMNGYDPNPAQTSSYDPNPAQTSGHGMDYAQASAETYRPELNKPGTNSSYGYGEQAAYSQPAANTEVKFGGLKGALFIIAFIGGMVGMIIASQTNPVLCVSIFGAMFAMFGIAAMFGEKKRAEDRLLAWSFTLGGLLAFVLPIIILGMKKSGRYTQQEYESYRNAIIGGAFALIGLMVMILPSLSSSMKKRRCTLPVEATCVGHNSHLSSGGRRHHHHHHHHRHRVYAPIWEYYIDGRTIKKAETTYTNVNVPQVGSTREIMVNPDDPEDIYRKNGSAAFVTIFVGLVFVLMGSFLTLLSLGVIGV